MLVDFYFAQKTFFPKNLLPNSGCGLSTDAAYTRVNTVPSKWRRYCSSRGIDRICPPVEDGINFFPELYNSSIGYCAINQAYLFSQVVNHSLHYLTYFIILPHKGFSKTIFTLNIKLSIYQNTYIYFKVNI